MEVIDEEEKEPLHQNLVAEPMDGDEDAPEGDGEDDDEIDMAEPEVELIEPNKPQKKRKKVARKILQSEPLAAKQPVNVK